MSALRYILAALIGLYFTANVVLAKALIDFKLNGVRPDAASHRWAPVLSDMGGVQSALWLFGVALYGAAAAMLTFRRPGARYVFLGGVALDFLNWRMMMTHPSYAALFGSGAAERDTGVFVILAFVAVAVWWVDRPRARKA